MNTKVDQVFQTPAGKYLVDSYEDWARGEGAPIHVAPFVDLLTVETKPWARFGVDGALCHLDGRDDFLTVFLYDLAPGAASAPMRHLYEEVFYVLTGRVAVEIDLPGGGVKRLELGPKSLFSAPMNAGLRLRNAGPSRARVAGVNDLRYLMQLYRNERFLFETPMDFPERAAGDFGVDCAAPFAAEMSHPNEDILPISLAGGAIGCDLVEMPAGKYARASRQMFGSLLLGVAGEGMTLTWEESAEAATKTPWRHGVAFAPPGLWFNQNLNVGAGPARFLSIELGSVVAPMFRPRRKNYGDPDVYAAGAAVVAFADQDPAVERLWREAKSRS